MPTRSNPARGATLVEFALVLPIFLTLIFTLVDFGLMFFIQHTMQFATREGARMALVGRRLTDDNNNLLSREESIVKMIREKSRIAVDPARVEVSIYPVSGDYTDPTDWAKTQDAGQPGTYMRVRARTDYVFITPVLRAIFSNGKLSIEGQSTYRNEFF